MRPQPAFEHGGQARGGGAHRREEVEFEALLPVAVGELVQTSGVAAAAHVVDEHVDAPELPECVLGQERCGVRVEQIGSHLHDAHAVRFGLQRGGGERVDAAGVEHEVRAFAGEVERDLLPDAAAGAGDDRDAVAQSELHQPSAATRSAYSMGSSSMSWPSGSRTKSDAPPSCRCRAAPRRRAARRARTWRGCRRR